MKPIPIPDAFLEAFTPPYKRVTIGAPRGLENDCAPVEAVISDSHAGPCTTLLIQLEDGDLEKLQEDKGIWLRFYVLTIPMFSIGVAE